MEARQPGGLLQHLANHNPHDTKMKNKVLGQKLFILWVELFFYQNRGKGDVAGLVLIDSSPAVSHSCILPDCHCWCV